MLAALELHKVIQKKAAVQEPVIPIKALAEELQVEKDSLLEPILVLKNMHLVELDENNNVIKLTASGKLANLE
jgi:Mn-dependent DtxR family transcriptional regulator